MSLVVYNSQSRIKEVFRPLQPGKVKMYVCGPTVYDYLHVGNFRGPVFYNFLRNWLEHLGYEVKFALNFTDVDDKIINRANKENKKSEEVSEFFIQEYKADFSSLGLRPHSLNPKVTDYMESIRSLVAELISVNKAYVVAGEVLYSIRSFGNYGCLSGRNPDELIAGARVEIDSNKKDPLDFALWKPAKPGEPSWSSPWGEGRPGWHIECSAMIKSIFGEQIDIHGGGTDLIFPHHENELAQSEGVTGKPFVRYWMHVNMLNFSGAKMSKSLGNLVSLRDFLRDSHPEIYKYMILSVHYRSVSDFGEQAVEKAVRELARFYSALSVAQTLILQNSTTGIAETGEPIEASGNEVWNRIEIALNDDLNTAAAFAHLFDYVRSFNSQFKRGMKLTPANLDKCRSFFSIFRKLGKLLALFQQEPQQFLKFLDDMLLGKMHLARADIDALVVARWQARKANDFARADSLRAELLAKGISVMDTQEGSTWEVTK